jgi:hypothetical protein
MVCWCVGVLVCAGLRGMTRRACGGFVSLKWGLLGPRRGFQAVVKHQSAEQIHCTATDLTLFPPPERLLLAICLLTGLARRQEL